MFFASGVTFLTDGAAESSKMRRFNRAEASLFLQLAKMYPGLLMNLQLYAREVPLVSLQPGLVTLDLQGAVKAFAIQLTGTQIPLFTLNTVSGLLLIIYLIFCTNFNIFVPTMTLRIRIIFPFRTQSSLVKCGWLEGG